VYIIYLICKNVNNKLKNQQIIHLLWIIVKFLSGIILF